jgi:hypothetical protein
VSISESLHEALIGTGPHLALQGRRVHVRLHRVRGERVVECSRDPRVRAELDASGRAAMERFVHHESTFSLRTALHRSLESELGTDDAVAMAGRLVDAPPLPHAPESAPA